MDRRICMIAVVALISASCSEDATRSSPAFLARDSSGVRIVESASPAWGQCYLWTLGPTADATIGTVAGAPEHQLTDVWSALVLPDGSLAVTDQGRRDIRIFDETGAFVRAFGGAGQGPGEYRAVPILAFVAPDTLIAWDLLAKRLTWVTVDGAVARTRSTGTELAGRLDGIEARDRFAWGVFGDGSLLIRRMISGMGPRAAEDILYLARMGDSMRVEERARLPRPPLLMVETQGPSSNAVRVGITSPFLGGGGATAVRSDSGYVYLSDVDRWEVRRYGLDGALHAVFRLGEARVPVTAEVIQRGRGEYLPDFGSVDPKPIADAYDRLDHPDSVTATSGILWDDQGYVWVAKRPAFIDQWITTYEVLNGAGEWLGSVELPAGERTLVTVGGGKAVTERRDGTGVPFLEIFSIQKRERCD